MTRQKCSLATIAITAVAATLLTTPANANSGFEEAHSLRSLDIMLMVTSLRCRTGAHDFRNDYHRFSAANLRHLNAASNTLKRGFQASYGERNPARALDRMGVKIANSYGDGHPWLSCADLKQVARDLSQGQDARSLATNARYLLNATRPGQNSSPPHTRQYAQNAQSAQITYNMTADWEKRP